MGRGNSREEGSECTVGTWVGATVGRAHTPPGAPDGAPAPSSLRGGPVASPPAARGASASPASPARNSQQCAVPSVSESAAREGRGVSSQYGARDEACPVSTGKGEGAEGGCAVEGQCPADGDDDGAVLVVGRDHHGGAEERRPGLEQHLRPKIHARGEGL